VVEEAAEEEVFVFLRRVDDLGAGAGFAFGAVGAVGGGAFDDEPRFMFNPANLASREFRSMVVVQDYYKPGKLFFFACLQRVFDLVDVTRSKKNTPKQTWDILLLLAQPHTDHRPSHPTGIAICTIISSKQNNAGVPAPCHSLRRRAR